MDVPDFRRSVVSSPAIVADLFFLGRERGDDFRPVVAGVSPADFEMCSRHGCLYRFIFGAREFTIFSKRGSPRSESQKGSSFSAP